MTIPVLMVACVHDDGASCHTRVSFNAGASRGIQSPERERGVE